MLERETIHVVEGDGSQRIALGRLLRSVGYEISLYASAEEFIETPPSEAPGCVITEMRLPGGSGLDVQRHLRELPYAPPVIVMTGFADVQMSVQCMKGGAFDFLTKPVRDQDLLDAVVAALKTDRRQRMAADRVACLQARFERLTRRERQVMTLVALGKLNKQIADLLEVSEITVKNHRGAAMKKMAAQSAADLVVMAVTLELHLPPPAQISRSNMSA